MPKSSTKTTAGETCHRKGVRKQVPTRRSSPGVKRRPGASGSKPRASIADIARVPDSLDLCQLAIRLLGSPLPHPPPAAAYLFQQLDQNVPSVVGAAVRLLAAAPTTKLFLLDVDNSRLGAPISSNYGATRLLLQKLEAAGVSRDSIELGPFDHSGMIHTLNESRTVVQHAKAKGWRSLAVLAPSFHLPRAAMTLASEVLRQYPDLRLHPFVGDSLPWQEEAQHSQGMVGYRSDFIRSELDRIVRYTKNGDIEAWTRLEEFFVGSDTASKHQRTL